MRPNRNSSFAVVVIIILFIALISIMMINTKDGLSGSLVKARSAEKNKGASSSSTFDSNKAASSTIGGAVVAHNPVT